MKYSFEYRTEQGDFAIYANGKLRYIVTTFQEVLEILRQSQSR